MKKKSYMNAKNIITEGFFEKILKWVVKYPALLKNPAFKKNLTNLNKDVGQLEIDINKHLKKIGSSEKISIKPYKLKDFA